MIAKQLADIAEDDIRALIVNAVPEGKTIDYKRELPGNSDADKKEFLADVSSFANSAGGDLIFGVDEAQGIPTDVVGLQVADRDQEIRRLDSIIGAGLDPRIRYEIRQITTSDGKVVLVIRTERSWIGPHRVTFKSHDKFYGRTSAGKYPLDVSELRTAFGFSQTMAERVRSFRADRIMALAANETPVPCDAGSKLVLHCIPFESVGEPRNLDISRLYTQPAKVSVMRSSGWNHRINLDGFLTFSGGIKAESYTQVFRSGIVESVHASLLNHSVGGIKNIPSVAYERAVMDHLPRCFAMLKDLDVNPPLAVALSLVSVRGSQMIASNYDSDLYARHQLSQDHLVLPEAIVADLTKEPAKILKPIFDLVWNAFGYPNSWNFDENAKWVQRR
jgi:hypothetical protein